MTLWQDFRKRIHSEWNGTSDWLRCRTIKQCLHPAQITLAKKLWGELMDTELHADHDYGNPVRLIAGNSSVNLQHHYYIKMIKKHIGSISFSHILEVGGGYGNQYRVFKKMGFLGQWEIADFPELLEIQKDFIDRVCENPVVTYSTLNHCWNDRPKQLLLGTFSLNEMPLCDREIFEKNLTKYSHIFIAHNHEFDGIDNYEYFKKLKDRHCLEYNIKHFKDPLYKSSWFWIASREANENRVTQ